MWRTERGCLHWLCKSVIFKKNVLFHLLTFLTTSFSWNILVSTSITASPLTQKKKSAYTVMFWVVIFANISSGIGRWKNLTPFHGWTSGSLPCCSASRKPYRKKRVISADFSPWSLDGLASHFFCLEPLTSILAANLSLWLLALDFLHRHCVSFTPSVLLFSCLFKSTFELLALKRLVPIDMNTKFPLFTVVSYYLNKDFGPILVKISSMGCSTKYFHQHIIYYKKV